MRNLTYQMTGQYALRFLAGSEVLMPVGAALRDSGKTPLMLNDVTALLIKKIQEKASTEEELLNAFLQEYRVEREEAQEALRNVLALMTEKAVLEQREV